MTTTDEEFILLTPVRKIKMVKLHTNKDAIILFIDAQMTYQMIGAIDRLIPLIRSVISKLNLDL